VNANSTIVAALAVLGVLAGPTFAADPAADLKAMLAARCFGTYRPRYPHSAGHNHFAHANPLVITVGGKTHRLPRDAARFSKEIDALIAFVPNIPTDALRVRSAEAFRKARRYFAAIVETPDR